MDIAWDVPIRMSDGVILKANVYRPADADGRPVDTPFPTIVSMTPYTKLVSALAEAAVSAPGISDAVMDFARDINFSGTPLSGITDLTRALSGGGLRTFTVDRELIRSGYTQVVVDVRGTGFSQGIWQVFQEREQQDTIETIEWAAQQAWSNGRIGMSGVSYSAINQIQAASKRPAALQAIVPIEPGGDLVRDVVAPGGGAGVGFLPFWLAAVNGLKLIPDVQALMQGNLDQTWLRDRIADPATFFQYLIQAITIPDVDSIPPELQTLLEPDSSLRLAWLPHAEQITAPTLLYGGWHDIFTNSQPRLYNAIPLAPGKKQLIMGDTYHLNPAAASVIRATRRGSTSCSGRGSTGGSRTSTTASRRTARSRRISRATAGPPRIGSRARASNIAGCIWRRSRPAPPRRPCTTVPCSHRHRPVRRL